MNRINIDIVRINIATNKTEISNCKTVLFYPLVSNIILVYTYLSNVFINYLPLQIFPIVF